MGAGIGVATSNCRWAGLGCTAIVDDPVPGSGAYNISVELTVDRPVAALALENGNSVEFYGFPRGALIVESGGAYTPPSSVARGKHADQLVNIWMDLAPTEPVPAELSMLQTRLMNLPPRSGDDVDETGRDAWDGIGDGTADGQENVQLMSGCNNGCCDFNWLSTFWQCQSPWDYSWFLYNYNWSYANGDDQIYYDGFVCSAVGTSTYKVNVDGGGGTWSVPEATYRTYSWTAGWVPIFGWDEEDVRSNVNSSTNPRLHTYCGGMEN